jgi:NADH dehydrogenase FAD-containing subunit
MSKKLTRRDFIKVSTTTLASAGVAGLGVLPDRAEAKRGKESKQLRQLAYLPKPKGPRVVVVGGGTAGLTIAKYLKKENPRFDVVLVEKRAIYSSCFSSNLWYPGLVNLEFLTHSFLEAAKNGDYTFFSATCIGLDRESRKVYTDQGAIPYDYLVLTPGIDYDYSKIGVSNPEDEYRLRTEYPAGWTMGMEHVTIKHKIQNFKGGTFIQTVPTGNYRCLPAPYERACMIAAIFKKKKLKAKVLVLDGNPDITIKKDGFHAAFNELYKGIIEYTPSVAITGVDPSRKTINTEFDSYTFDDAAIYPNIRASRLIELLDLVNPESPQKEANINVLRYHVIGDERVYVAGDSRPMPFSKSANTANTEGRYVARVIAAHAAGKKIDWVSPRTECYSMVNVQPREGISVDAGYAFDVEKKEFSFSKDTQMFENRDVAKGTKALEWAQGIYRDLFDKKS